jgi:hypothetical protein
MVPNFELRAVPELSLILSSAGAFDLSIAVLVLGMNNDPVTPFMGPLLLTTSFPSTDCSHISTMGNWVVPPDFNRIMLAMSSGITYARRFSAKKALVALEISVTDGGCGFMRVVRGACES